MGKEQIRVIIKQGPQSWAIIQQQNGSASMELAGTWFMNEAVTTPQAFARIVREESAETARSRGKPTSAEDTKEFPRFIFRSIA